MPKKGRRGCTIAISLAVLGSICCLAGGALFLVGDWPDRLLGMGRATSDLEPLERIFLTGYLTANLTALDGPAGAPEISTELTIQPGDSAAAVVARLEAEGVVEDGTLLRNYLRYRGLDTGIEAGRYRLSGEMSIREIASILQKASADSLSVTLVEGWRREQIGEAFQEAGLSFDLEAFLRAGDRTPEEVDFLRDIPDNASVEGFLFPDTYSLQAEASAEEVILLMLENFERRVTADIQQGILSQDMTIFEGVILASIVEREAVVPEERGLIASVFLNRLSIEMNLEADPTVQYALGRQPGGSWWKSALTFQDLEVDSPYNTYQYPGLPPGPIANPGLASLLAVAAPAESDFLYFRATCDGTGRHNFARTFEEHEENACP